jgi:4-hydroxy-tetrahydrodipicolinate reductase
MIGHMKIMLSGYGKMGREVERIANQKGHKVCSRIDPLAPDADAREFSQETINGADAVIEFALAEGIEERVRFFIDNGIPTVIATTGWQDKREPVLSLVKNSSIGFLYSSNFSVGAHLFFEVVRYASGLFNRFPEFEPLAYELHHRQKKDSPSGTALNIGNILLAGNDRKQKLVTQRLDRPPAEDEIHFASVRGGYSPGIHTVLFDSLAETVEITHNARNRAGMALGAVLAAEWIRDKKGVFEFSDFIQDVLSHRR